MQASSVERPSSDLAVLDKLVSALPECADKARLRGMLHAARVCGTPDGALIERLHTIVARWASNEPILALLHVLERGRPPT
jgi:hypothetical protein